VRLSTIEAFEKKFNLKNIVPVYGLAEATLGGGDLAPPPRRSGSTLEQGPLGRRPCRGVSVRIRAAPRDGGELPPNREGEIWVKSPGVMQGYYNNRRRRRRSCGPDGWLRTGDLGFVDADGLSLRHRTAQGRDHVGGETSRRRTSRTAVDHLPGIRYFGRRGRRQRAHGHPALYVVAEVREPRPDTRAHSHLIKRS